MKADEYIRLLGMTAHPEGGYFREMHRSEVQMDFPGFEGPRSLCTSIVFLLKKGQSSAFHRIRSDEIWYYQAGDPLEVLEEEEGGVVRITRLGPGLDRGEVLQHVVRAGTWFGARLPEGSEFALAGCQVSPGFDFRDFELRDSWDLKGT